MRESVKAADEAERDIATKDIDKADTDLKQATALWSANNQTLVLSARLTA